MVVHERWMMDLERLFRQFDHARVVPGTFSLAAFRCILASRRHKKALGRFTTSQTFHTVMLLLFLWR